jgi:hypothetical protein
MRSAAALLESMANRAVDQEAPWVMALRGYAFTIRSEVDVPKRSPQRRHDLG